LIVPGITKVTPLNFENYPLSHSLFSVLIWGLLFGGIYFLMQRYPKGAIVLGFGVVSHWFLDLIVHRPDLPLFFGESPYVGFGLWNSPVGTLLVEGSLFCAGVFVYMHTTYAKDRIGTWAFWSLVGFLVIVYIGNFVGPVPPSVQAIAWVGNAQWILIAWAYWVDRHRSVNNHTTADIGG